MNAPDDCKMTFADVLKRDYKDKTFNFSPRILSMKAVSIDEMELNRTKLLDKTMDTCVGIATHDSLKRYGDIINCSHHRLLLVELKLNCTSSTSITPGPLLGKVSHTRTLLAGYPVDIADIFIFTKELAASYKRTFINLKKGGNKNAYLYWEAMSPEDFNNYIAFEEDLPFEPINKKEDIISDLTSAYYDMGIDSLIQSLSYWRQQMANYHNSYQLLEEDHVMTTVKETLQTLTPEIKDEDELTYLEMEFPNFLKNQPNQHE